MDKDESKAQRTMRERINGNALVQRSVLTSAYGCDSGS
jgi:hypothetical protein